MEQITIKHLTFAYDVSSEFSLSDVNLQVKAGEILLITGVSGCGKTTLLRHLKREYMPAGVRNADSEIRINGTVIENMNDREQSRIVGFVGQDVDAMQVTDKVWHELSFGLENLGYTQDVMQRKVAELTAFFGLESIYHEKLCNLSGGQKQLVNLAAVMAMEPEVLVLDEPTSQLDPVAATEFFRMIEKINKELGTTIVMTEHRLEEVFSLCDRVCVMEQGRIAAIDFPESIAQYLYEKQHKLRGALPAATNLYFALGGKSDKIPLTVNEGRRWLETYVENVGGNRFDIDTVSREQTSGSGKGTLKKDCDFAILADELWFRYKKDGRDILKACNMKVEQGKITAILGGNGAGKSTLLNVLGGYYSAYLGDLIYGDKKVHKGKIDSDTIGMLPQNPQVMFAKKTVEAELQDSLAVNKKAEDTKCETANDTWEKVIDFCDLRQVLHQHPFDLSGGQMQKLALAKLILEDKDILLLDEPAKGMDYGFKEEMGRLLRKLVMQGKTIVMVSHDVEFCAKYADICGLFFDGNVVSLGDSRSFFLQNTFYTTAIARICKDVLPQVLILEDVLQLLGCGKNNETQEAEHWFVDAKKNRDDGLGGKEKDCESFVDDKGVIKECITNHQVIDKAEGTKNAWLISFIIIFLVMPITIYVGHAVLLQRKYYFISLLLVLEAIACFYLQFEKRKPKVREIMLTAAMCGIVVAGRAAFYMVPSVKPMAALVIIAGIGLGAETGFLVGSMAMLVSNIFFGQGPWTPWQMFTMGMLGFLAGVIFRKKTVETTKKKLAVCLFGFLSTVLVYGGIMNSASVLMYQENVSVEMILSAFGIGLPYDVIHGVATFMFLWVGCRPLLDKLQRVREKTNL